MVKVEDNQLVPVIMAGGVGTRLWPLSRQARPKQFLALIGQNTFLQQTINRLQSFKQVQPIIVCNEEHRFLVAEQVRQLQQTTNIILEPEGRSTAPSIALAAFYTIQQKTDAYLLVLPADHLIKNTESFEETIKKALPLAGKEYLVTFGVSPTQIETGYGYIEQGKPINTQAYHVAQFIEKPSQQQAQDLIKTGRYLWNSGMFLFKASSYLAELKKFRPDIYYASKKAMANAQLDMDFLRVEKEAFTACPSDSIDYAVMEKTDKAAVVVLEAEWTDIGSWSALWNVMEKDQQGNSLQGDVIVEQTTNSLILTTDRLVAALGVNNLVVIETKDAVLVADKSQIQQVKTIVQKLQQAKRSEVVQHAQIFRPWGVYDAIDKGDRYQVKHITINPGAKLSLQKHHHRTEHWIIVKGTARVNKGKDTYLLTENQSTYIPIGEIHSLENPGKIPLELIEVQSGSYLGEDDIVRLEDKYGR